MDIFKDDNFYPTFNGRSAINNFGSRYVGRVQHFFACDFLFCIYPGFEKCEEQLGYHEFSMPPGKQDSTLSGNESKKF
ncbi:hypothetical protein DSCO28_11510 [Desulfosarcina ovata subsp. sediminis]|uniref:Uncharacterized protein n=1 Tax=Desulfosarcina ovata subsp. sediminis TaxID=885957 RepID=A0A5K7ZK20_9BACT|nr:hypothetical protein DSCO28_11510 [Desulfosarcina ovata subsp. sediminis]